MAGSEFSFDEWKNLASKDPEAFERQRERLIRETINQAPAEHRSRLLRLQWRVDMERKRQANPMASCVKLSRMMLDSVYGENGLVSALNGQNAKQVRLTSAKVLDLTKRKRSSA